MNTTDANKILIRCPGCKAEKIVDRHETDPPTAVVCETKCPVCVGSDFSIVYYYDAAGNDVSMETC